MSLEISKVEKQFGRFPALKGVSLFAEDGEFLALLGPSGSGKTTLLRIIAGLEAPDGGGVSFRGEDLLAKPVRQRGIGFVFQHYALFKHMTVAQNIAFGMRAKARSERPADARIKAKVAELLAMVQLDGLGGRYPAQLSGGQRQRVALARALAIEPKILLLDEPFGALDAKVRRELRRWLRELHERTGLTTIFVTHDQEEANTVCDRIAVFNEGRIQQVGTPMYLYEKPANLFVANFLGTANILEGSVKGEGAARSFEVAGGGSIPVPAGVDVPTGAKLVFRPQYATIGTVDADSVPISGIIAHREFLGATVRYGVEVGKATVLVEAPFHSGDGLLAPGNSTVLGIKPASALWLAD